MVVGGDPERLKKLINRLEVKAIRAPTTHVIHCDAMRSEYPVIRELNDFPTQPVTGVDLLSTFDYKPVANFDRKVLAERIAETLCKTVDFKKLIETAYERGCRAFIETGPNTTCTRWVGETLKEKPHFAAPFNRRGSEIRLSLLQLLAGLTSHRFAVDLSRIKPTDIQISREKGKAGVPVEAGNPSLVNRIVELGKADGLDQIAQEPKHSNSAKTTIEQEWSNDREPRQAQFAPPESSQVQPSPMRPTTHKVVAETKQHNPKPFSIPLSKPGLKEKIMEKGPFMPNEDAALSAMFQSLEKVRQSALTSHRAFLENRHERNGQLKRMLHMKIDLMQQALAGKADQQAIGQAAPILRNEPAPQPSTAPVVAIAPTASPSTSFATHQPVPGTPPPTAATERAPEPEPTRTKRPGVIWDEQDMLELALGKMSKVFGPEYAEIDTYEHRVKLPAPPYLFVHRVTKLEAELHQYKPCMMRTEYDIHKDMWYSVDGQIPVAVAVEAGQCDLLLIAYLGVDFKNKG